MNLILTPIFESISEAFNRFSNGCLSGGTGILLIFLTIFSLYSYEAKDFSHLIGMQGFHERLLKMHFKLYEGYVKNTNDLLSQIKTVDIHSYEYGALKRRLAWEFDGMRLHELYFSNLGGKAPLDPKSGLYQELVKQFGSYENWKRDFIATGTIRGIGWSLLYFDPDEKRLINTWINEHDTGHLVNGKPILVMDVFEHAYMPQYGLNKMKYIEAFFANIDWQVVSRRYATFSTPQYEQEGTKALRR